MNSWNLAARAGRWSADDPADRRHRDERAIVMVAVFAVFATLSTIDMKQMGVGLAVAVPIDATLIRAVLLPATMKLLGDWNWYLPRWLEWVPSLAAEGAPAEKAPPAPALTPTAN